MPIIDKITMSLKPQGRLTAPRHISGCAAPGWDQRPEAILPHASVVLLVQLTGQNRPEPSRNQHTPSLWAIPSQASTAHVIATTNFFPCPRRSLRECSRRSLASPRHQPGLQDSSSHQFDKPTLLSRRRVNRRPPRFQDSPASFWAWMPTAARFPRRLSDLLSREVAGSGRIFQGR